MGLWNLNLNLKSISCGCPWWLSSKTINLLMQEMGIRSVGQEYPLEESMTTHSSIFAWEIPWTEEPGGL